MSDAQEVNLLRELYMTYFDSRDAANFVTLFAPEGAMVIPGGKEFAGYERLAILVQRTPAGGKHIPIEAPAQNAGDRAVGRSPCRMEAPDGGAQTGTYEDDFVRTPDGWHFYRRAIVPDA